MIDDLLIAVFKLVELVLELPLELYRWLRSDDAEGDE
jgi:hypothetical protein